MALPTAHQTTLSSLALSFFPHLLQFTCVDSVAYLLFSPSCGSRQQRQGAASKGRAQTHFTDRTFARNVLRYRALSLPTRDLLSLPTQVPQRCRLAGLNISNCSGLLLFEGWAIPLKMQSSTANNAFSSGTCCTHLVRSSSLYPRSHVWVLRTARRTQRSDKVLGATLYLSNAKLQAGTARAEQGWDMPRKSVVWLLQCVRAQGKDGC